MEARLGAFGMRSRTFLECTVSIEQGRTWQELIAGTNSRIAIRCVHCRNFVTPEREHLIGWRDGKDVFGAGDLTRIACPSCGAIWEEKDRVAANQESVLVHRGQTIDENGVISGDPPGPTLSAFAGIA